MLSHIARCEDLRRTRSNAPAQDLGRMETAAVAYAKIQVKRHRQQMGLDTQDSGGDMQGVRGESETLYNQT